MDEKKHSIGADLSREYHEAHEREKRGHAAEMQMALKRIQILQHELAAKDARIAELCQQLEVANAKLVEREKRKENK